MSRFVLAGLIILFVSACGPKPIEDPPDSGEEQDAGELPDAGEVPDSGTPPGPADTFFTARPPVFARLTTATFSFIANTNGVSFECSLDAAAYTACTSPTTLPNLAEGPHTFSVRALNADGVPDETPVSHAWTIDTSIPDTTITSAPTGDISEPRATVTSTCNEASCAFECSINAGPYAPCAATAQFEGLSSGTYNLSVRASDSAGNVDPTPATAMWNVLPGTLKIRIAAANLTSGNGQDYTPGHGVRIFQGLDPDIVLIQEMNYGAKTPADIRTFVDTAFGPSFAYYREPSVQIPNGIISRFPIIASGSWDDQSVANRDFAWARIDVPGPKDLWAVSVHFLTTGSSERANEASALRAYVQANVPAADFLVIGGDLNTGSRTEAAISTLSSVVVTSSASAPYPVDQSGNSNTNAQRTQPYDWLLADPDLNPLRTAVVIGANSFPAGLVFDSRVYTPIVDVAPVLSTDSGAPSMQHMAVVKDFTVSY